jgi:nucleotide-binding universal stress UspA family protein
MTTRSPSVIVGVDGSEPAAEAARAAAREAARRELPLRLVRAFHWPAGDVPGMPDAHDACAASRRSAHGDLERLRRSVASLLPERALSVELLDGRPEVLLCRAAQEGDLLVVGASGLTWGPGSVLGSVAESVAATAPCPVLLHRTPNPLDRHHGVVVGVNGAEGSREVLTAAVTEARLRGEALTVVHAWRQFTEDAVHRLRWRLDPHASSDAETAAVEPLVSELRDRFADVPVEMAVERGRAGQVLVRAGSTAGLLVVGRRDLSAGGPGATVHSVLHRVDVPVLSVPVAAPLPVADAGRTAAAAGPLPG